MYGIHRLPRVAAVSAGTVLAGWPAPAAAHQPAGRVSEAAATWNADPLILAMLGGGLALYLRGDARLRSRGSHRPARLWLMLSGVLLVASALVSPLDALASVIFSAHMAQHLVLTALAPLLLVLARPLLPLRLGLPPPLRRAATRVAYRIRRLTTGLPATLAVPVLHAGVLWFWHVPAMYEAALASPEIHALEHLTLLATALLVWSVVLAPARPGPGLAALVFTALQGIALGALLTFSPRILYPSYRTGAWGLSALEHQQLGGLLMWMPTGVLYAACALWLLARRVGPLGTEAAAPPVAGRPAVRDFADCEIAERKAPESSVAPRGFP